MSERTGATDAQIAAAAEAMWIAYIGYVTRIPWEQAGAIKRAAHVEMAKAAYSSFVGQGYRHVPPDHRIVAVEDLAAAAEWLAAFCPTYTAGAPRWELHALIDRIRALIGPTSQSAARPAQSPGLSDEADAVE